MFRWFTALSPQLQTGIVAGAVTLIGILLKDLIITNWKERRSSRESTLSVYRSYADPLASAASTLLWRLREIFYRESYYLQPEGEATHYERYKQISTLYRMARLLGWIQAYRRELAFLPEAEPGKLKPLEKAIASFESALADGSNIEIQRLDNLCRLWQLNPEERVKEKTANELEIILKRALHAARVRLATDLPPSSQDELVRKTSVLLAGQLNVAPILESVLQETKARAMQALSIKEVWLYRDFQAGIGDLMIRESPSKARRFDVLGYRDFESMIYAGSADERRWLQRLASTIENVNISRTDHSDARVELLRNALSATAKLVVALDRVDAGRNLIDTDTLRTAQEVLVPPKAA